MTPIPQATVISVGMMRQLWAVGIVGWPEAVGEITLGARQAEPVSLSSCLP